MVVVPMTGKGTMLPIVNTSSPATKSNNTLSNTKWNL